jgi:hypothetical protein
MLHRRPAPGRLWAVLAGLSTAAGPACSSPDTVVLVGVQGTTARPIRQLQVTALAGGQTRSLRVPDPARDPIFLPTNFTLQLPRSVKGSFNVTVVALDEAGQILASGEGMLASVTVGARNDVTVMLGPGTVDAGAPDAGPPDVAVSDDVAPPAADAAPDGGGADGQAADAPADAEPDAGGDDAGGVDASAPDAEGDAGDGG